MRAFYETVTNLIYMGFIVVILFFAWRLNLPAAIMGIDWQAVLHAIGL